MLVCGRERERVVEYGFLSVRRFGLLLAVFKYQTLLLHFNGHGPIVVGERNWVTCWLSFS